MIETEALQVLLVHSIAVGPTTPKRPRARTGACGVPLALLLAACGEAAEPPMDARELFVDETVVQRAKCLAKPGPGASVTYTPRDNNTCTMEFDCDWQVTPDPSITDWVCSLDDLNSVCRGANYQTTPNSLPVAKTCAEAKEKWPTAASWCASYADYLPTNPNMDPTFTKCIPVNAASPPAALACKWPKTPSPATFRPLCTVEELQPKYKGSGKLERGATQFSGGKPIRVEFVCEYMRPCSGNFTMEYRVSSNWDENCAPYGGDVFDYCHLTEKSIEKDEPTAYIELDYQVWTPADPKSLADFEAAAKTKCDGLIAAPGLEAQARQKCLQIYESRVPNMMAACCEAPKQSSSTGADGESSGSSGPESASEGTGGPVVDVEVIDL